MVTDHELLPKPPRRLPALSTRDQQARALTLMIQHAHGPGHVALRAALTDALRIAGNQPCTTHHVPLPRRGDTLMECQRCAWTKTLTAADVDRELDTFERYIARARKGAA